MIECEAKLKAWGNSIGLVIPKDKTLKENLKPNQKVKAIITPVETLKVGAIFGKLKKWKRPTNEIMGRVDRELGSKILG